MAAAIPFGSALPRTHRWLSALCVSAAALAACSGSDSGTSTPAPASVQQGAELQQPIADLESKVGFRPIAPAYLPEGLDPAPETAHVRDENQQTAIIAFFPAAGEGTAPGAPSVLEITEDPAANFECPLCPAEGLTELELAGVPALGEEAEAREGVVSYTLYFVTGDLFVTLNAEWNAPPGSGLNTPTDEMKQELVRVAESMVEQV